MSGVDRVSYKQPFKPSHQIKRSILYHLSCRFNVETNVILVFQSLYIIFSYNNINFTICIQTFRFYISTSVYVLFRHIITRGILHLVRFYIKLRYLIRLIYG